jgi:hypothetical protein
MSRSTRTPVTEITTMRMAKPLLAVQGMMIKHLYTGEYLVYPKGHRELAYFTNDLQDAITTGIDIGYSMNNKKEESETK